MFLLSVVLFWDLVDHRLDSHDAETFQDHTAAGTDVTRMFSDQRAQQSGRPVSELAKWAWYLLWGNNVVVFHLLAMGLHVLASLLVTDTFRLWGANRAVAAAAAVLFLVQTAHYEPVHHISMLDYQLAMILALLTLSAFHRGAGASRPTWLVLGTATFALGLMSHPGVVSIVPVVLLQVRRAGHTWRRAVALVGPMVATALVTLPLIMRATSTQTNAWETLHSLGEDGVPSLILDPIQTGLWLLSRLVTTAHWLPVPAYRMQPWEVFIGLATVVGLACLAWRRAEVHGPGLWLVATLVPFAVVSPTAILPYLPAGPSRYVYFASAGSCLLLACACWGISHRWPRWHPWTFRLFIAGLVVSSYLTTSRTEALSLFTSSRSYQIRGEFADGIEQMRRAMERAPAAIDLQDAYRRLSLMTMAQGLDAMPVIEEGLQLFPANPILMSHKAAWIALHDTGPDATEQPAVGNVAPAAVAQAYHHMGTGFNRRKDLPRAASAYGAALSLQPERQHTRQVLLATLANLSTVLVAQGRQAAALDVLQQAVALDSQRSELHANLGALHHKTGNRSAAMRSLARALDLGTTDPAVYWTLARLYEGGTSHTAAADVYERLMHEGPDLDAEAAAQLGMKLGESGRLAAAEQAYRRALELDSQQITALVNLGWILQDRGQIAEAIDCYRDALAGGPHSIAQFNLGLAYVSLGDIDKAREAYEIGIRQHGSAEAIRVGAVADLEGIARQQGPDGSAQMLLDGHWPTHESQEQ